MTTNNHRYASRIVGDGRFHDEAAPAPACHRGGKGCDLNARYSRWLAITLIICMAAVLLMIAGCTDAQFAESKSLVASYQRQLEQAREDVHTLLDENVNLESLIAELREAVPPEDPAARALWEQELAKMQAKLGVVTEALDQAKEKVNHYADRLGHLADKIAASETGEEALGATISTIGSEIGVLTGQPLVGLVAGLLGFGLRALGDRKRKQLAMDAGSTAVAAGLESARNDELEARNPGFLVIEKAAAAINHQAAGVSDAIERVSREANAAIAN